MLERRIREASGLAEVFWKQLIITPDTYGNQEVESGGSTFNATMWCDTSAVIRVWYFCIDS